MMRRRVFLACCVALLPARTSRAQQSTKVWRIGFLGDSPASASGWRVQHIRAGLADLGYVEGRNFVIEARWTEGQRERLASLANELTRLNVDVIVTHGVNGALAAKAATLKIPIVVANAADFVENGLVASLSHPGGNITGLSDQVLQHASKQAELLKEVLPKLDSLGVLWQRDNPTGKRMAEEVQVAAQRLGLRVRSISATNADEIRQAFEVLAKARVGGVIVVNTVLAANNRAQIAQLALQKRLATISSAVQFAEVGGLMSYGADLTQYYRRAATLVDKILKGAKPADIPIEQPTIIQLVINMKTAKALAITIPQSILVRAAKVIE